MTRSKGLVAALVCLAAALLLRHFVFDVIHIRTGSMEPNLREGATVVAARLAEPEPGDIVVLDIGDGLVHVKRLVAVGPAVVELADGRLYVDGEAAFDDEAPLHWFDGQCRERAEVGLVEGDHVVVRGGQHERVELADGEVWVLGDARHRSHDSRQWGALSRDAVVAVVSGVAWDGPACDSPG